MGEIYEALPGRTRHYKKVIKTKNESGFNIIPRLTIEVQEGDLSICIERRDIDRLLELFEKWKLE